MSVMTPQEELKDLLEFIYEDYGIEMDCSLDVAYEFCDYVDYLVEDRGMYRDHAVDLAINDLELKEFIK